MRLVLSGRVSVLAPEGAKEIADLDQVVGEIADRAAVADVPIAAAEDLRSTAATDD
jgi:hypothetical protein